MGSSSESRPSSTSVRIRAAATHFEAEATGTAASVKSSPALAV